ncbi:hypothetical protein [Methylibium sp.]|uniref:hypothetical protein n=1 Tax=Methylibium sp. TaxID=2067992 RepID=UPI003D0E8913
MSATTPSNPVHPAKSPPLVCGNCQGPMQVLALRGHYGQAVEVDLCAPCHLVWFDVIESARLNGPAILALIGHMAQAQSLAHQPLRERAACPRCRSGLKTVHNRSRWGRSLQLECSARHGAYQSFAEFLFEKGLVRPMSSADRAALIRRDGRIDCVNCGAPIAGGDAQCGHCRSVPSLLDVARLARALDPEGATEDHPVHATAAHRGALQCGACGAALPPGQAMQCAQCGATLAVSRLADAHRQVQVLAPLLQAHAEKPAPHTVARRMAALSADLPRQREWILRMRADTAGRHGDDEDDDELLSWSTWRTNPLRAVFIALLLWWAWWMWS